MLGDVAFSADKTFGQATANIPAPIIHRCSVLIKSIFSISGYEYTMKKGIPKRYALNMFIFQINQYPSF